MTDSNTDTPLDEQPETWRDTLAALRDTGCSILVTGQVGDADSATFMRRRGFGAGHKTRILALANALDVSPQAYLRDHWSPTDDHVRIITRRTDTRSVRTADPAAVAPAPNTILGFQTAIINAVSDMADPPAPSLRVAVDSLGRLIEDNGQDAVETMMNGLNTSIVRGLNGRIYYHYRRQDSDDIIRALDEYVDARIELAYQHQPDDSLQYRWHVDERTSKWMAVDIVG